MCELIEPNDQEMYGEHIRATTQKLFAKHTVELFVHSVTNAVVSVRIKHSDTSIVILGQDTTQ